MSDYKLVSLPQAVMPRHPQQEIVDLLAVALLRLRAVNAGAPEVLASLDRDQVGLGFAGRESVNADPDETEGVHA